MLDFTRDVWPVISFFLNIVLLLVGGLGLRWLGSIIASIKQDNRIAILELKEQLGKEYAKAAELQKMEADLRREINIVGRIERGFEVTAKLIGIKRHSTLNGEVSQT